jgi:hypothetical protein
MAIRKLIAQSKRKAGVLAEVQAEVLAEQRKTKRRRL